MNWQDKILEKKSNSFKYKVCTDSIAKTAGTQKRSAWSPPAKNRYDRCLKKVTEAEGDIKRGGGTPGKSLSKKELKDMIARLQAASSKKRTAPRQTTFSFT